MAMALALTDPKTVIAGFESGHVVVWHRSSGNWPVSYLSRPHTQPILSLALHPNRKTFVTSSADAIIAKHLIPSLPTEEIDVEEVFTSHAPELSEPLEILKTKHAGQQGLSIRGDGKLLCSTGWDARGRVYVYGSSSEPTSTSETIQRKKMKEIAVLAWHKGSVFCSAFSNLSIGSDTVQPDTVKISEDGLEVTEETRWKDVSLSTRREKEIQEKKLIVLGGKDGKVSLWEMDVS